MRNHTLHQIWDVAKEFQAHDDYLLKCLIAPSGRVIATTSADKTIKLWAASTIPFPSPAGVPPVAVGVGTGLYSSNHGTLTTSSEHGAIRRGSAGSVTEEVYWGLEKVLTRHQRWVWDCVFTADSMYLISASSDSSAKLWDLSNGEVIRNYGGQGGHSLSVSCVALNDLSIMQ